MSRETLCERCSRQILSLPKTRHAIVLDTPAAVPLRLLAQANLPTAARNKVLRRLSGQRKQQHRLPTPNFFPRFCGLESSAPAVTAARGCRAERLPWGYFLLK